MANPSQPALMRERSLLLSLCMALSAAPAAWSQPAPLQQRTVQVQVDSGTVRWSGEAVIGERGLPAPGGVVGAQVVFSQLVQVPDATWLRLTFDHVQLAGSAQDGNGSFLRMTSLHDGAHQVLNAISLDQWRNTSAYFNGDAVLVELLAYPANPDRPGDNRVVMREVLTGDDDGAFPLSICDGVDERVLSNDPRDARSLPVGCTSWLFNDRHYCLLTAGHCAGGTTDVVEFNVPMQGPNGGWVFSHPDDQYAVDPASKQTMNSPCSNDWSYFGAFPNSNTGLTMLQAQGDSYPLANAAPPVSGQDIRIRGYGTTSAPVPPTWNRAQKEHSGPFVSSSGTTLGYRTDTTGGNSGSAVIDLSSGLAIGIHTCGGCHSSGGSNVGTAIHHSDLQDALANPQGVCDWPSPGPPNNTCETAIVVFDGTTPFDNVGATTNGPEEPEQCGFFDDPNIQADVWFEYVASCTGELAISLCKSEFDAKLGVYGFTCPTESGTIIACNSAACGMRAELTIPVIEGQALRLRVGGHNGAQGAGLLDIACYPKPQCPADLNGDGTVDVSDLLTLLGAWGPCSNCPSDINGDGIVDGSDLLDLLDAWGECG